MVVKKYLKNSNFVNSGSVKSNSVKSNSVKSNPVESVSISIESVSIPNSNSKKIISLLENSISIPKTFLENNSVFELAVAVILSAQCTDERVNKVTKNLFSQYSSPKDFAEISPKKLEKLIFSTGFYRAKSKNIINFSKKVLSDFNGEVPSTMSELVSLPGIGRKTANIILTQGFNIVEGIAVDTHVKRVSNRLGFSCSNNPAIIERDLMNLFDKSEWYKISNLLILHGRKTCYARKPNCASCIVSKYCPSKI